MQKNNQEEIHAWHAQKEASGAIWGIKTLLFLQKILGSKGIKCLLFPIMFCFWVFNKTARKASEDYLQTLKNYALTKNLALPKVSSFKHFLNFGYALFDKLLCWSGQITLKDVDVIVHKHASLNNNSGTLIIGSHLGNIEVCRALAEIETSTKIHVLMHMAQTAKFNTILKTLNPQSQVNIISVTEIFPDTMIFLKSALDRGDFVAILADRLPINDISPSNKNFLEADFLGRKAKFPKGPFMLAILLKVPTYFMVGLKEGKRYAIYLEPMDIPDFIPRNERHEIIHQLLTQYLNFLTHYCLQSPLQWFNFYNFWQDTQGTHHETDEK